MKHEYSPQQIEEASDLASNGYTRIGINFLLDFLDHLPEPETDEWQECRFEDIRKGDRVREVVDQGNGTFETTEGIASVVTESNHSDGRSWRTADRIYELACDDYALDYHKVTLYRIPKPVVHPDPAEHPVIVNVAVDKPGTNLTHRYDYATWDAEEYYDCWGNDGKYYGGWQPTTISEWEPAKVVPKVVEDDR